MWEQEEAIGHHHREGESLLSCEEPYTSALTLTGETKGSNCSTLSAFTTRFPRSQHHLGVAGSREGVEETAGPWLGATCPRPSPSHPVGSSL